MRILKNIILPLCIIGFIFFNVLAGEKDIKVKGKITDGADPLKDVDFVITGSICDTESVCDLTPFFQDPPPPVKVLDNLRPDGDGKFETKVTIRDTLSQLRLVAGKKDYLMKMDSAEISGNTVDVGEIVLEKTKNEKNRDEIRIFGDVKNDQGDPIKGATIFFGEIRMYGDVKQNFKLNVLYNDRIGDDAKFDTKVNYTPNGMKEMIIYTVAKKGFASRFGMFAVTGGDEIDAGTIVLKWAVVGIKHAWSIKGLSNKVQAKGVTLYSLSGRKIYSGKMLDLRNILDNNPVGMQPLIIQYNLINQEKVANSFIINLK